MSLRLIDAFNPLQHTLPEAERALRAFRASCVGVAALALPFAYALRLDPTQLVDPMPLRWLMTGGALALLAASFRPWFLKRWSCRVNLGLSHLLVGYFCALAWANEFVKGFSVGLLFVFAAAGLAQGLAYSNLQTYGRYLLVSTGMVLLAIVCSPDYGAHEAVVGLSAASLAALFYYTVQARVDLLTTLTQSESHLAEAQEAAGMGSWEQDFRTGEIRWSAGMYQLTGLDPATAPTREAFTERLHPDDAERMSERLREHDAMEVRYLRAGSAAWRHAELRRTLVCDAEGRRLRVFGTLRDTTDAHAREAALHAALGHAEAAAAAKSAFLANMSHEIRTPLTAILGYAELLAEEADSSQRNLVVPIVAAGERLLSTLNSVLDFARMEAGESDLVLRPVELDTEAQAVVQMLTQRASVRGLELRAEIPASPLTVLGDPAAIHRVLTNLVSNAIKFTPDGEVVLRVASRPAEGAACIEVCDTGRGMSDEFLKHLFEPFRQASTGWARSHEGTGLGLAIVKQLVEGMHGSIAVESTLGHGTCFTILLPLTPDAPPAAEAPVEPVSVREPVAA